MTKDKTKVSKWKGAAGVAMSLEHDPKKQFLDEKANVRTTSLFYEHRVPHHEPLYTLRGYDMGEIKSLKRLYMEERDLTEYIFAEKYCYNYNHWLRLKKNKQLAETLCSWKAELELLLVAEATQALVEIAGNGTPSSGAAAKFLASKGWEEKASKGRPKKADVEAETKRQALINKSILAARDRIQLKKND